MSAGLEILFRDERFVAIDKPSGLLVHRNSSSRDSSHLLQLLRDQLGRRVYPAHRLDRATSGVIIFALDPGALRALGALFHERRVVKTYWAVVRGFAPEEGTIDHPLRTDPDRALVALTSFRRLAICELPIPVGKYPNARYSLLEVNPQTGRHHQIRRHLAHLHHPIAGDTIYGEGRQNRLFRTHFQIHRLLLMARSLGFRHPFDGQQVDIRASLDHQVRELFCCLGWSGFT